MYHYVSRPRHLVNRNTFARATACAAVALLFVSAAAKAQTPNHIVIGEGRTGDPPLTLFTDGGLLSGSGHGPSVAPGAIVPVRRMQVGSSIGKNVFQRTDLGGYSFSTDGFNDLGFDFAAAPYNLALSKLPGPPSNFTVNIQRIGVSAPADLSIYTATGLPQLLEDNALYPFGDAFNAGHVHPFWLMRRPGQVTWNIRFTSSHWLTSEDLSYTFTTVPGRGELVPLDMSSVFNADIVDSDNSDTPVPFDGAGRSWLLNGHYGTFAGLPSDGALAGFELGGANGARLAGAQNNARLDNGTLSLAGMLDLVAGGQDDRYLSIEFLLAASGAISTSDAINVTFHYGDGSTQAAQLKRSSGTQWHPYRPFDNWLQTTVPLPQMAIGRNGNRDAGFDVSTGSAIDAANSESFYMFRTGVAVHESRVLTGISFGDYTGGGNVAVMAILGIRKAPLEVTTIELAAATEDQPYQLDMTAAGTPPFRNWNALGLPDGLSIDPLTGRISGTPDDGTSAASPYSVTISVDDSIHIFDPAYPAEHATVVLQLAVDGGGPLDGDIDADGDVDSNDRALFVAVLLGIDTDANHIARSDINSDGFADADDIQPFIQIELEQ